LVSTNILAAVRGKALLVDAKSRTEPGPLLLCMVNGEEKKFEILVEGKVMDAHFSPDGKQVVYGLDKMIKIMDLKTRKITDIGPFESKLTYFNWCLDNKIYWSDGDMRQIFSIDIKTKKKAMVHKGNKGRTTVSLDGKKAAWVIPPVASFIGGKTYRFMGGCGGSVSPSGKYLTSNLTTSHKLMGIFSFDEKGPSKKPIASVTAPGRYSFNGFYFGRTDDWVCYVIESPKSVSPMSYICYWRTGDHFQLGTQKYCIKDFFDETDVLPAGAKLERITVCTESPLNSELTDELTNVGRALNLKVVGHYTIKGESYTPQLREGITWKADKSKMALTATACRGVASSGKLTVTAQYKGKQDTFDVTVLPKLTGNGFKAEYFNDAMYSNSVLTRIDEYIDFRWSGRMSPDKSINGRKRWSARWTGKVNVQVDGEYTFYFLQGEGNDGWVRKNRKYVMDKNGKKRDAYAVYVDGKLLIHRVKNWNYPWAKPKASKPVMLKKGRHTIEVTTVDAGSQPNVVQLHWSGPGIKQSLLGGSYVHSGE